MVRARQTPTMCLAFGIAAFRWKDRLARRLHRSSTHDFPCRVVRRYRSNVLNMLKDLTWVSDRILTARAVRCIRFTTLDV